MPYLSRNSRNSSLFLALNGTLLYEMFVISLGGDVIYVSLLCSVHLLSLACASPLLEKKEKKISLKCRLEHFSPRPSNHAGLTTGPTAIVICKQNYHTVLLKLQNKT